MNTKSVVFVYQYARTHKARCLYYYEVHGIQLKKRTPWKHVATLDPAAWIQYLLNNPDDRTNQIEGLMK